MQEVALFSVFFLSLWAHWGLFFKSPTERNALIGVHKRSWIKPYLNGLECARVCHFSQKSVLNSGGRRHTSLSLCVLGAFVQLRLL